MKQMSTSVQQIGKACGTLLVQLAGIFGFLLVLVPYTRPAGSSLLVFAGLGLVGIEFAAGQAGTYCGFTGGSGFTP